MLKWILISYVVGIVTGWIAFERPQWVTAAYDWLKKQVAG